MKKLFILIILTAIVALQAIGQTEMSKDTTADESASIKSVFEKSYFNGAFNELDTVSMEKGFHPDFAMFYPENEKIDKYPLSEWLASIKKGKPNKKGEWTGEIKSLDVSGKSAVAKVEMRRKSKLEYTDYFLLLKFESSWRIVGKIFDDNGTKFKVNPADGGTIKSLLETSYFNGAFNGLDTVAMAKGFHADFAIFSPGKNELIDKYPIKEWIADIEKRKAAANFKPTQEWKGEVKALDITGNTAMAKIELQRNGKLVFTDYLLLLRFNSGWKIVGKVYNRHS
jgi:Putative lumazine-binding